MTIKLGSFRSRQLWLDGLWACIQAASCGWSVCDERQATQHDNHNSQGRGPGRIIRDTPGQQGADEDKLTAKTTTFVAAHYGSKVEEDMTSHRYQMRKSKIVDPIQYGWHASEDGTTLNPTTLTVGVSAAPLTILHLAMCHVQRSAVTMMDTTVVTNIPGQ